MDLHNDYEAYGPHADPALFFMTATRNLVDLSVLRRKVLRIFISHYNHIHIQIRDRHGFLPLWIP